MKIGFQDDSFAFELVRNLGFIYYGGGDLGDMMATVPEIAEGDFESWYAGWHKRAQELQTRADAHRGAGHLVSAREAYLRASTYFRMAEFYLHGDPSDPRIITESRASQKAYAEAARLTGPTWEPIEIPYQDTVLPGYFYKVDDSGKPRPTLIFHGGFDSSVEELFYYGGAPAIRRGYNCLTFDGPGTGRPVREQKLYFRPDWESVVTPAVDYAVGRPDVDAGNLALLGMSMGGYQAARAVAFERRIRAAVFFDGVWDLAEAFRGAMPKDALDAYDKGDAAKCEEITYDAMKSRTQLRWMVMQGIWSLGASGWADVLDKVKSYNVRDTIGQIQCPCLVLEAEGDQFFRGQPQKVYDSLQVPKKIVRFTSANGSENHCQSGALAYKDEVVFNWLDETLKLHGGVKA